MDVSIDTLFGRDVLSPRRLEIGLRKSLQDTPAQQRFRRALDFCWEILKGICGSGDDGDRTPADIAEKYTERVSRSELDMDGGTATIAVNKELWYFLLMPEPDCGWKPKLAYKDEYADMFRFLGDPEVLRTLYYLNERDNRPFTLKLIERAINVDSERATDILQGLASRGFVSTSTIELDDGLVTVYALKRSPMFLALMVICDELVTKSDWNIYHWANRSRPYFWSK